MNKIMGKITGLIIILCMVIMLLVGFLLAGHSSLDTMAQETERNVIAVSGSADVLVVPDQIVITLGIESRNKNIDIARAENVEKLASVLSVAKKYNIDSKDIQMDYMDVKPCDMSVKSTYYTYETISPDNLGYEVRKRIVVTIEELSVFEFFLTDVIKSGVEYVQGVDFKTSELRKHKDEARELAIKAAREKADAMASVLGQRAGKAVKITEQQEYYWSWYDAWYWGWYGSSAVSTTNVTQNASSSGQASQNGETVVPGQIKVRASVNIEFILE
jgi:uncharacterized protein